MLDQQLLDACRALRTFFSQPAEKITPAAVAGALPHVREFITGVEELGDRMAMVELALRSLRREELHAS
jgi:hypothetical protein